MNRSGNGTPLSRFLISISLTILVFTTACGGPATTPEPEQTDNPVPEQTETTSSEQPGTTTPEQAETEEPEQPATEEPEQPETIPPDTAPEDPLLKYEGDDVFGFMDGSEPYMPVWGSESGGWTWQEDDPREQVIINEYFRVMPGEETTFKNRIVLVKPGSRRDIEVYGTLIIEDSLVLWEQTEHQQTRLRIKPGGKLIVKNSYVFQSNQYWLNWEYENLSTVYLDNFAGQPWTCIHGSVDYTAVNFSTVKVTFLNDVRNSKVNITDAHHIWFELFPPAGNHQISFPEKRQWIDWDLSGIWPGTAVSVTRSYLYERDISISNDTHITVLDTPSGFSLGWAIGQYGNGWIECELRDLGDPDNDHGVFYENMVWDLPGNNSSLTVKNSLLERAWPVTWGQVKLKIYNSNLVDPRNYGGPATLEIYDSTIDHIAAYQEGRVYMENCRIRYDIEVKDANSIIYGYGVTNRDGGGDIEIIEVDGGTYIGLDSQGVPW